MKNIWSEKRRRGGGEFSLFSSVLPFLASRILLSLSLFPLRRFLFFSLPISCFHTSFDSIFSFLPRLGSLSLFVLCSLFVSFYDHRFPEIYFLPSSFLMFPLLIRRRHSGNKNCNIVIHGEGNDNEIVYCNLRTGFRPYDKFGMHNIDARLQLHISQNLARIISKIAKARHYPKLYAERRQMHDLKGDATPHPNATRNTVENRGWVDTSIDLNGMEAERHTQLQVTRNKSGCLRGEMLALSCMEDSTRGNGKRRGRGGGQGEK